MISKGNIMFQEYSNDTCPCELYMKNENEFNEYVSKLKQRYPNGINLEDIHFNFEFGVR